VPVLRRDHLNLVLLLVQDYEQKGGVVSEIEAPDPIEAISSGLDTMNLTTRDLVPPQGSRRKGSAVLSRKRPLTAFDGSGASQRLEEFQPKLCFRAIPFSIGEEGRMGTLPIRGNG